MTDDETLRRWMEGYLRAWASNDPDDIRALFTEDARYFPEPHLDPWEGHEAIVQGWLDHKDEPGDYTFGWEQLALAGDLAFVEGWTDYTDEKTGDYRNLWVIRFANDGRASEFTEWWVKVVPSGN